MGSIEPAPCFYNELCIGAGTTIVSIVRRCGRPSCLFAVGIALPRSPLAGVLRPFLFRTSLSHTFWCQHFSCGTFQHRQRSGTQRVSGLWSLLFAQWVPQCEG